jgi:hypothetical protein
MEANRGLPVIKQKRELTKLTVVLQGEGYYPGDTVWLRGDSMKHPYASEVFEEGALSFILVPTDHIVAAEGSAKVPSIAGAGSDSTAVHWPEQ